MQIKTIANDVHLAFLDCDADYYYSIGGRFSAKTYEILSNNIDNSLSLQQLNTAAVRKVYSSLRDSLYRNYIEVIEDKKLIRGIHYTTTVSPLNIKFPQTGSEILFKGLDDPEKTKGLANIHRLVGDEINEWSRSDFESLDMSIRGKKHKKKRYLAHNPIPLTPGNRLWFQELFDPGNLKPGLPVLFNRPGLGKVAALKTTYKDNHFCPEDIRQRLEGYKITNPNLYQLWTLGNYAQMEGVILKNWDIVPKVPQGITFLGYGLDFGFSSDPAACVAVWGNSSELWVKGLIYNVGMTNDDLYDKMVNAGIKQYDKIIADSAEPKSIEYLYRKGFKGIAGAKKRANYKAEMANTLNSYKIHLIEGDIDLQREFSTWSWARDREDRQLPKPADGNDHYIDSLIMLMHEIGKGVTITATKHI